ncbi:esterase OVCA2 isoform X3 [Nilaparvata lugens]|uniref:esterase OVCA2 isoform X3 n=1 Tax=Nilaparvata lugens TaxID=108931 RepID=UPI00193E6B22|nr:esterase OVCA2 isoform X3 [Nilaparvata lugens]
MAENKLRILCLHGYRQNKNVFREKLGQFRKNLKNHAEFHFIDAPHEVKDSFGANQSDERSWWFTSEDNTYQSKIKTDFCIGLEDSIALVQKTFANEGPFDGILGFSQGAAFTAIICGLLTKKALDFELKFVMIVAGFKSLYDGHAELYEQQINIASLHVIGGGDEVISQERSKELTPIFADAKLLLHSGGHYVPANNTIKKDYIGFLESFTR